LKNTAGAAPSELRSANKKMLIITPQFEELESCRPDGLKRINGSRAYGKSPMAFERKAR
jgi:hypothetical protein